MRAWKLWLPVVLWAGLILSSSNDAFSATNTGGLLERIFGDVPPVVHMLLRKAGHVVAYGILGALAFRANRRVAIAFAVVLMVASCDEWLQSRAAHRTGTPWDVLLDLAGAALGMFLLSRGKAFRRRDTP